MPQAEEDIEAGDEVTNKGPESGPDTARIDTAEAPTPEQIQEWKTKAANASDYWDRLLRQTAEFENFKKRATRERQDAAKYANEALLEKLVPIMDNFDMAMAAAASSQAEGVESLRTGIGMIYSQLKKTLAEVGLEQLDVSGQAFDPNWHEALSQHESAELPEGRIVQQLRKGYRLRDRLLRPAGVVVSKKPSAS